LNNPEGLAFDHDGNLYVANTSSDTILEFSPSGVDLGVFASGLDDPRDLAFDSNGNLYVSKSENDTIRKFARNYSALPRA
jgi:serine/threonine-protein kinase